MENYLLVDANYLCHRSYHSTGGLQYGGIETGVAFGLLRDLDNLHDLFGPTRTVLAFDSKHSLRKEILSTYKSSRSAKPMMDEEREERNKLYEQIYRLKTDLLPKVGYRNIIERHGYEADDVIAKVAFDMPTGDEAVIVTADTDLFQCISPRVVYYNPSKKKVTNAESFIDKWGVTPSEWMYVKALAGCDSDDVVGIKGIGEITAAAYYAGKLKKGVKYDSIVAGLEVVEKNLPLVKLPFPGIELPELVDDELTEDGKQSVLRELGISDRRTWTREPEPIQGFDV